MHTNHRSNPKRTFPAWVWVAATVILIGIAGLLIFQQLKSKDQSYPLEISVTQAAQKRDQGAFILDVRQPEEWVQFHIPGATLIPLGELSSHLDEVPKDREVVVVCRTGRRSQQGRDILRKAGYTQVTSMAGGVTQWQAQGLPITNGK